MVADLVIYFPLHCSALNNTEEKQELCNTDIVVIKRKIISKKYESTVHTVIIFPHQIVTLMLSQFLMIFLDTLASVQL